MKGKKLICFVFAMIVLFVIATVSNAETTYTATTDTSNGIKIQWSYELNANDQIINLKCTNLVDINGDIEIPSTINGKEVKTIGFKAFANCSGITGVTIPSSVVEIDLRAFSGCSGIKTLNLTEGLQKIGGGAFGGCAGISEIIMPDSVTVVEFDSQGVLGAFEKCSGLKTIKLSKNLSTISRNMFRNCSGLSHIEIPESVTNIDYYAFMDCNNLKSIIIPDKVVSIAEETFDNSDNLTIYGNKDSYAQQYAQEQKIKFDLIENYGKTTNTNQQTDKPATGSQTENPSKSTDNTAKPKEDPTIAKGSLPNTGIQIGIIVSIIVLVGLGIFGYVKYRKLS